MSQSSTSKAIVRASSGTVLLVEDDHDVRVSIRSVLEEEGYTVLTVTNGRSAIELLEVTWPKPQLILLDLKLPVMDGWEFVDHMRRVPGWTDIPVVVLSARRDRTLPPGIVDFLAKPVRRDPLLRVVAQHCGAGRTPRVVETAELPALDSDDSDDSD